MLAFLLFAFVSSITPGPTNLLVLSNSARYGLRSATPIIIGASLGAALMVWLIGCGLGQALLAAPRAQQLFSAIGILWLSWLAWKLFSSPVDDLDPNANTARLGLWGAASMQVINPKTWMMALAVASVFVDVASTQRVQDVTQLALVFLLITLPCLSCWALLGSGARRLSRTPATLRRINQGLALLLLLSAWASLWH